MKKNQKIKVNIKGNSYRVTILRVYEELPGGWFMEVRFKNGKTMVLSVRRKEKPKKGRGRRSGEFNTIPCPAKAKPPGG